jgi:hypothetical protein
MIMKTLIVFLTASILFTTAFAQQEFTKAVSEARQSYAAGKLDDARFAMQQALQELDLITGKEILKILPLEIDNKKASTTEDNVSGSTGFFGVVIHREYGNPGNPLISLEIIGNSPFLSSINALLALPMMGGDQKMIRIQGYKALVSKVTGDDDKSEFEIQLPLNNALISFKAPGYTQEQVIKMAGNLPVTEIAKMLQ